MMRKKVGDRKIRLLWAAVLFALLTAGFSRRILADGEIYLERGEIYTLTSLTNLRDEQEYDIFIENPDIVGLNETGKEIVAVAAGTSEVTVRITNPDSAYSYVFVVEEYVPAVSEEYEDYGQIVGENEGYETADEAAYEERENDHDESDLLYRRKTDDSGNTAGMSGESADMSGETDNAGTETGDGIESAENRSLPYESDHEEFDENADSPEINENSDRPENVSSVDEEKENAHQGAIIDAPIRFSHGSALYDLAVPRNYTLWVCAESRGRVTVLYAGVDGRPVPYRIRGNMIYIHSEDLPQGLGTLQVIAANEAGTVYSMSGYDLWAA